MNTQETLVIFSRYPEAGKTKTRMIPALGAEGAADLQRRLSEHTLKQARQLKEFRDINVVVYFNGGNKSLMTNWLGTDLNYQVQAKGDLGIKMSAAFTDWFAKQQERVVIIGIDCPGVNKDILNSAFTALENNDLVLGEAEDGGYYLIGLGLSNNLKTVPQELFIDISWGTEKVFQQTKAIAQKLNLATAYLPVLRDLDRPEDLDLVELIAR